MTTNAISLNIVKLMFYFVVKRQEKEERKIKD